MDISPMDVDPIDDGPKEVSPIPMDTITSPSSVTSQPEQLQHLSKEEEARQAIDMLRGEDVAARVAAANKLESVATVLGEERTREELLPFLTEGVDDEDEVVGHHVHLTQLWVPGQHVRQVVHHVPEEHPVGALDDVHDLERLGRGGVVDEELVVKRAIPQARQDPDAETPHHDGVDERHHVGRRARRELLVRLAVPAAPSLAKEPAGQETRHLPQHSVLQQAHRELRGVAEVHAVRAIVADPRRENRFSGRHRAGFQSRLSNGAGLLSDG